MRLRRLVLAAVAAAGALALPGAEAEERFGSLTVSYDVPTAVGHVFLQVVHPTRDGKAVRAPVVLTASPYSGAFGRNRDAAKWVPHGYARATVDVVGTGNSGGCFDYGGPKELKASYDTVEWIARQPWSTGKVGMTGGSYDGTTAMGAATMRPPHLATIVPEAAISRWYDYAYSGGVRYTFNNERNGHQNPGVVIDEQGLDTPLLFDFGFAVPPPTDVQGEGWQERVRSTTRVCEELEHTQAAYRLDPDYDRFWQERDYARTASKVDIPVLVAHNWGDWNVKQQTAFLFWQKATKSPVRRLWFGSRWHGHDPPEGGYAEFKRAWMDRWLKGVRNGVERSPAVVTQTADRAGPGAWFRGGVPRTTALRLHAADGGQLQAARPRRGSGASYVATGAGTETGWLAYPGTTPGSVWLLSPVLARDVRVFGSPVATLQVGTERSWLQHAVSLVDVDADFWVAGKHAADETIDALGVTRGWLDSRYSRSLARRTEFGAGGGTSRVELKPTDYTFRKGHRIGVLVTDVELEWTVAKPYDGRPGSPVVTLATDGRTRIDLPVVGGTRGLFR